MELYAPAALQLVTALRLPEVSSFGTTSPRVPVVRNWLSGGSGRGNKCSQGLAVGSCMDALWIGVPVPGCFCWLVWGPSSICSAAACTAGESLDQQAGSWWGGSVAEKGKPDSGGCTREREILQAWISIEGHARHAVLTREEEGTEWKSELAEEGQLQSQGEDVLSIKLSLLKEWSWSVSKKGQQSWWSAWSTSFMRGSWGRCGCLALRKGGSGKPYCSPQLPERRL